METCLVSYQAVGHEGVQGTRAAPSYVLPRGWEPGLPRMVDPQQLFYARNPIAAGSQKVLGVLDLATKEPGSPEKASGTVSELVTLKVSRLSEQLALGVARLLLSCEIQPSSSSIGGGSPRAAGIAVMRQNPPLVSLRN